MTKYVRLCKTVTTRGTLVPLDSVDSVEKIQEVIKEAPDADWYTSVYYYNDEAKDYFDKNNSIKGYTGTALTNRLFFDIDSENNLQQAKNDAVEILNRLSRKGVDIRGSAIVYFSGNKGFHIEIPISIELKPDELKTICSNIAHGIKSFDPAIYDTVRLIRLANTKHQKSGLYKIPMSAIAFSRTSIEDIKETAKTPRIINPVKKIIEDVRFLDEYRAEIKKPQSIIITSDDNDEIRGMSSIDFEKCPSHVPRCVYALQHGIMEPGERGHLFFRLANYYRNQGLSQGITHRILKGIAELNAQLYPEAEPITKEEIWTKHIASAYSKLGSFKQIPGATGISKENELLIKYCHAAGKHTDKNCIIHGQTKSSVVKIDDVFGSFSKFAEGYDKNRIETGIEFIDRYMHIATGTVSLLVGACGSGKTSLALNILANANAKGIASMFFSLDMHKNLLLLKLARGLTDYTQEEIIKFYREKNEAKKKEISDAIKSVYGKTFFDFTGTLTMENMRDKVLATNEKFGQNIKLVMVDYASRVSGPHSDRYANATYNALRSKEVASDTDAAWIFISQISRNTGDGSSPLRTKRAAKESGDWEEAASNVITMWRPFMGCGQEDDVMRLFLAKNRMGREVEQPLWWSGEKGLVWDMAPDELKEYKEFREEREIEVFKNKFSLKK